MGDNLNPKTILEELVKFKTVVGNKPEFKNAWEYIDSLIRSNIGWNFREYESNGFTSRVYSDQKYIDSDEKDFDIYLYANLDVVPAKDSLFKAKSKDGKLYGRGVVDMKFGAAVAIATLNNLPQVILSKKIALILTTDEEQGGLNGAKYLTESVGFKGKCLIGPNSVANPEKYNFEIKNKGTIHTRYFAKGKASHGSRPWNGENAIEKLMEFFYELKEAFHKGSKTEWNSTINLGVIKGGFATNAVPDEAMIQVDYRYVTLEQADEYYIKEVELMKKHDITKELIVDACPINVSEDNKYFQTYKSIVEQFIDKDVIRVFKSSGSHDVREFYKVGITPIIFMPRGADHHTDNEWINLGDLDLITQINTEFITDFYKN